MKTKVIEIDAVHKQDLKILLEKLGQLTDIENGQLKCTFCDKTLSLDNITCIYPREGKIVFCCNDLDCHKKALKEIDEIQSND